MARLRFRHTTLPLAMGFAFRYVSSDLERVGDVKSLIGDRPGALTYHLVALVCLLAALACFIYTGVKLVRYFRERGDPSAPLPPPPPPPSGGRDTVKEDDAPFDPDAIMARYLAERNATGAQMPSPHPAQLRPVPRGFGRRTS